MNDQAAHRRGGPGAHRPRCGPAGCLTWLTALLLILTLSHREAFSQASDAAARSAASPGGDPAGAQRKGDSLAMPSPRKAVPMARRREASSTARRGSLGTLLSVLGALGIVLGLFLLLVWLLKRGLLGNARPLPPEVVQSLGRASFAGRQQLHLLRVGRKLVLVSVTAAGAETLTEITDREEVDRLAGLCQQRSDTSATVAFQQTLQRFSREPAPAGFAGPTVRAPRGGKLRADRRSAGGNAPHG